MWPWGTSDTHWAWEHLSAALPTPRPLHHGLLLLQIPHVAAQSFGTLVGSPVTQRETKLPPGYHQVKEGMVTQPGLGVDAERPPSSQGKKAKKGGGGDGSGGPKGDSLGQAHNKDLPLPPVN